MIDIMIANLIFWPVYIWLCTLPARAFEAAIRGQGLNE